MNQQGIIIVWGQSKMPEQQVKGQIYAGLKAPEITNQEILKEMTDLKKLMRVNGAHDSKFSCEKMLRLLSYLLRFDEKLLKQTAIQQNYSHRYEDMFIAYNKNLDRVADLQKKYEKKRLPDMLTKCKSHINDVVNGLLFLHQNILVETLRRKQSNLEALRRFMESIRIDGDIFHDRKLVSPSYFKKHYNPFFVVKQ